MERCLEAAATEIDWELGYTAEAPAPDPPPPTRRRSQPRAGRRALAPVLGKGFGVVWPAADTEAIVSARNSWYRHRLKLRPLKVHQGIA